MSENKIRVNFLPALLTVIAIFVCSCTPFQSLEYKGLSNWDIQTKTIAESKLSAVVQIYNPNKYKITVKRIEADITVSGSKWSHYTLDSLFFVPPQSNFSFPIQLMVKNADLLNGVVKLVSSGSLPYTLQGKIKGTYRGITSEVPFVHNGKFSEGDLKF